MAGGPEKNVIIRFRSGCVPIIFNLTSNLCMDPPSPPELPDDVVPADCGEDEWQSLRPFLKYRGYRLVTQRDTALVMAEATNEPVPEEWAGPPQDDDALYSASNTGAIFEGFRLSDSRRVVFKIVDSSQNYEADIYTYLRLDDPAISEDPRNKAIPVFEIMEITPTRSIVVTEAWGPHWNYPNPIDTWEEFAEFGRQVLEGLAFLHSHRIAHLDISDGNILAGPPGEHKPKPQRAYAFIDFELSIIYSESDRGPYSVTGSVATYVAPEMSETVSYDPFKADIWQMGELLSLAAKERGFEMESLVTLLAKMKHEIPDERPTAEQALAQFLGVQGA
ncbi:kinase-like domain-containing protein [Mycena epipterygia]|nr:kinase-like domain-containing protein [Mycena epipterygia]